MVELNTSRITRRELFNFRGSNSQIRITRVERDPKELEQEYWTASVAFPALTGAIVGFYFTLRHLDIYLKNQDPKLFAAQVIKRPLIGALIGGLLGGFAGKRF